MSKRKLIIHAVVYLFIAANAIPVIKNDLASSFFWVAVFLALILFVIDVVRLMKYGIRE